MNGIKNLARMSVAGGLSVSLICLSMGTASAQDFPLPTPAPPATVDTFTGQSVQVRADADGDANSNLVDFRWNVTQINAESLNGLNTSVPLPMSPAPMLRSLTGTGAEPLPEQDGVVYDFTDVTAVDNARTLNLFPQDEQLSASVKAEFTLNGEPVKAQDIVGKGGTVSATYTVTNNTTKSTPVTYKTIGGKVQTRTIDTDQPMIVIAEQLNPQSWGQYNAGSGLSGADGRGNYQTQWVGLPFAPLSKTGEAKFGWTAVIPEGEGEIPAMAINVAPIYIPASGKEPQNKTGGSRGGVPGASTIAGGVGTAAAGGAQLVRGFAALGKTVGGGIRTVEADMPGAISDTKGAVKELEKVLGIGSGRSGLPSLKEVRATLTETSAKLGTAIDQLRQNGNTGQLVKDLQGTLGGAVDAVDALDVWATIANEYADKEVSECITQVPDPLGLKKAKCKVDQGLVTAGFPVIDTALKDLAKILGDVSKNLPTTVGDLEANLLQDVQTGIDRINDRLFGLQTYLTFELLPAIGGVTDGMEEIFGAIDAGIEQIRQGIPGEIAQIGAGANTLGSGFGEIGVGARELISTLMALAVTAESDLKKAAATVNTLKAELAGLIMRAGDSPLPYGGGFYTAYQPTDAPEMDLNEVSQAILLAGSDTVPEKYAAYVQPTNALFGAFQFVLDPANSNRPDTVPRILIGLLGLLIAGIAFPIINRRRARTN